MQLSYLRQCREGYYEWTFIKSDETIEESFDRAGEECIKVLIVNTRHPHVSHSYPWLLSMANQWDLLTGHAYWRNYMQRMVGHLKYRVLRWVRVVLFDYFKMCVEIQTARGWLHVSLNNFKWQNHLDLTAIHITDLRLKVLIRGTVQPILNYKCCFCSKKIDLTQRLTC